MNVMKRECFKPLPFLPTQFVNQERKKGACHALFLTPLTPRLLPPYFIQIPSSNVGHDDTTPGQGMVSENLKDPKGNLKQNLRIEFPLRGIHRSVIHPLRINTPPLGLHHHTPISHNNTPLPHHQVTHISHLG